MTSLELKALDRAISVQLDLLRHVAMVDARVVALFDQMRRQLVSDLSGGKALTAFGRDRLNTMLKSEALVIDAYYKQAQAMLAPSITEAMRIVTEREPLALRNILVTMNRVDARMGMKLVNIDIEKFDALFSQSAYYVGPDGAGGIAGRYARIKQFITDNGRMEASTVFIGPDGSINFDNGRHRYAALRDAGNSYMPVAMEEASVANAARLGLLAEETSATVSIVLDAVVPSAATLRALVTNQLVEGAPSAAWWKRQSQDTAFRFANAIRQGVAQGQTNDQIFRALKQLTDLGARNSRALVHTSVMQAAADARLALIEENKDIYNGYRQLSTLDGHTTPTCIARSGLSWDFDKKPIGHDMAFRSPPLHWNCRSIMMGVIAKPLGDGARGVPGATRSSAEGQIARDTSFDAFLSRRTPAQQDAQLGVGRAQLWRDGKITLQQLTDHSGNALTLEQLRALYE